MAASDVHAEAVDLYRWNVDLTAAYFELIAFVEVALRNACAQVLTADQLPEAGVPRYLDRSVLSGPALDSPDRRRGGHDSCWRIPTTVGA